MSKNLVIVESPAKAKTIGKFLGRNYKVLASVGHVRDLPKSKMGIDIENDFEPQYITIRGKGDVIKELKKEGKKAKKVFLATDPDREGEAIAWHLSTLLKVEDEELCRVTFHEITKDAIKSAIKEPQRINHDLVDAQQARRMLDRLVGYSISPMLWRKVRKGLSAGRVQSVATKLICDREKLIEAFIPKEYWSITPELTNVDNKSFKAEFYGVGGKKLEINSSEETDKILAELDQGEYAVSKVNKKVKSRSPGFCFTTSSLQQEAANRFGFSTKKTMIIAQQLYEGIAVKGGTVGLITYMRTDSTRISDEAKTSLHAFIKEELGENYLSQKQRKKSASKNAQDAHEAIRPTAVLRTPESLESYLDKNQLKLYKLIWERFVASEMADALSDSLQIIVQNGDYEFRANGSVLKFDGFLKIYTYTTIKETLLPNVEEGDTLALKKMDSEQHFTQPPARFTEAALVKEMEERGIGRPSTYAPTISTILGRGYVEREKKMLKPTELGNIINEIMENYFASIIDVGFTADLEMKLDEIGEGGKEWKSVIRDFYQPFEGVLKHADEELEKIDLTEETDIDCEKCGNKMVIKHGRYGKFMACSNYPECSNTKAILNKVGVNCPVCKVGDVVERKTKKYKSFYGCSEFPDCNFMSWYKPTGKECPVCSEYLLEYKTKRKHEIKCSNKECGYTESIPEENEEGSNGKPATD